MACDSKVRVGPGYPVLAVLTDAPPCQFSSEMKNALVAVGLMVLP
jgi:hypothetical protein